MCAYVCVTFFPEPPACLLHSEPFTLEALCIAVDLEFSFTIVLGILDWPRWVASISLGFVSLLGRHIAQLLLEKECIQCIFFFFWDLACVKISFSLSSHTIDIELKVGNYFPWEFWRPRSIFSCFQFYYWIVGCFFDLVTLYVTFLRGWGEHLESFFFLIP